MLKLSILTIPWYVLHAILCLRKLVHCLLTNNSRCLAQVLNNYFLHQLFSQTLSWADLR